MSGPSKHAQDKWTLTIGPYVGVPKRIQIDPATELAVTIGAGAECTTNKSSGWHRSDGACYCTPEETDGGLKDTQTKPANSSV